MNNIQNPKIVFMGTPEFGANILKKLISLNLKPILIVSQPDKKLDRKKKLVYSAVKEIALKHEIAIIQPEKIKDACEIISSYTPDLMITAAYGQFIPEKILNLFNLGAWNIHASLLPKLRGGAPIHWALINGESQTGVSLMRMVKKMDAGNWIAQEKVEITNHDTYFSLHNKLLQASSKLIQNHINSVINQSFIEHKQNESEVSFGLNITNQQRIINWKQTDLQIYNLIRGLNDQPVAKSTIINLSTEIKIYESELTNLLSNSKSVGTIEIIDHTGIYVCCGNNKLLKLKRIQFPNKKPLLIKDLVNGNFPLVSGMKFHE